MALGPRGLSRARVALQCSCLGLALWLAGCASGPPRDARADLAPDLVEITDSDPGIRLDIRYATTNNFLGRPVYTEPRAFLQRPAAAALTRVSQQLEPLGFGLIIFDGYRPWSVTKTFWEAATPSQRRQGFVANPRKGSRHNRGCAVDLTLCDRISEQEVQMPTGYDDFTAAAAADYSGGDAEARARRALLRQVMEAEGFHVLPEEWWHFDYREWRRYPVLDVSFEALDGSSGARQRPPP